jgi:hypothetical protein
LLALRELETVPPIEAGFKPYNEVHHSAMKCSPNLIRPSKFELPVGPERQNVKGARRRHLSYYQAH